MLTVLIASRTGSTTLDATLEALALLEAPAGGWRLVVVGNGDAGRSCLAGSSAPAGLPLTALHESRVGQNAARNRGLACVEGDLVVFTDDDVIPRADWLARLRDAADRKPAYAIFGGSIRPRWDAEPKPWLIASVPLAPTFAARPVAADGAARPEAVFSPNMAIRASLFRDGLRFDETIGPRGSPHDPMGSETELLLRLGRAGHRAWLCRDAVVWHRVQAAQLSEAWILARAVRYGRGQRRLGLNNRFERGPAVAGVPVQLAGRIAKYWWRGVRAGWSGAPERRMRARWKRSYLLGRALQMREEAHP